jgi:hypothetical protein
MRGGGRAGVWVEKEGPSQIVTVNSRMCSSGDAALENTTENDLVDTGSSPLKPVVEEKDGEGISKV